MTLAEGVGLAAGILTMLGIIVAVVRYLTRLQLKVPLELLQAEKKNLENLYSDLTAKHKELVEEIAISRRVGAAAMSKKRDIEDYLSKVMDIMQAGAGSVYIPLLSSSSSTPQGLIFLSVQPLGNQAEVLKRKIIPLKSLAGRCFTTGQSFVITNSKKDPQHFGQADKVSGYHTKDTLNFALHYKNKTVGVLQLLNKTGSGRFSQADISSCESLAEPLSNKVADFLNIPDYLEILGITPEREPGCATVMFCDLTNSSILFNEINVSAAVHHLNEYFETACDIAFKYGATVDKYVGDGILFRFNVPRPIEDHQLKAVKAAFDIKKGVMDLKYDLMIMSRSIENLFIRIGIACGPAHEAVIGHPQYQSLTIFGQPVSAAVNLCDAAKRDDNIIVIDSTTYNKLSNKILAKQIPNENIGKALTYIESGYELLGLK